MKINGKTEAMVKYAQLFTETAKNKEVKSLPGRDSISISPAARLLQECLASEEPINSEKVAVLKGVVARGEYSVDANALADKILTEISSQRAVVK